MKKSIIQESREARGIRGLSKKKKIIIFGVLAICLVSFGVYSYSNKKDNKKTQEASIKKTTAKKGDIKIAIEEDGKVVAEDGVELSFSVSGNNLEVEAVFIKEGDKVKKGDKIATVKTETLELNVRNTYSAYSSALADYNETIAGPSDENITKLKSSIEQAKLSLAQAKISLEKTKTNANQKVTNAEEVIRTAKEKYEDNISVENSKEVRDIYNDLVNTIKSTSIFLSNLLPDSDELLGIDNVSINNDYESNLGAKNINTLNNAGRSYNNSKELKEELDQISITLSKYSNFSDIDSAVNLAEETLDNFEQHLYDMQNMLDATITSTNLTQTQLDSFKSTNNTNRSNLNSKISSLDNSISSVVDEKDQIDDYEIDYNNLLNGLETIKIQNNQDIENAEKNITARELSLKQSKDDYSELTAPLTTAETASAKSRLTSASINLEKARLDLDKATITSPIDGEVTRLNYKAGDIIVDNSTSDPVAIIINNETLFIEVKVEEADINKLEVGQKANATFDAINDTTLDGEISYISLTSQTDNSGIVTYLVRIIVTKKEGIQIREGMTAFVEFVTAGVKNVLLIPVTAVSNVAGKPSTQLETGEWVEVITGFTDGKSVEVISGLKTGDKIIY